MDYAQLVKLYAPETPGKGAERKSSRGNVNATKRVALIGLPRREHVSTSHVERHNLTIRMQMRRFTRLTNAHSKKTVDHACSIAMLYRYYNYCRVHATLGTSPAVAPGLADHVCTIEELIGLAP